MVCQSCLGEEREEEKEEEEGHNQRRCRGARRIATRTQFMKGEVIVTRLGLGHPWLG